jgi:glycosyltransferase involved in cell wall biosynthesis
MNNRYSELISLIEKRKPERILLISFEDSEIIKTIKENFQGELKVLTKAEFVGLGIKEIARLTREQKFDIVIISNINSQVNRTKSSIKVLALISKSFNQIIYFDENDLLITNKIKLSLDFIPKLFAGIVVSIFVLIKTYFYFTFIYPLKKFDFEKKNSQNKLIVFLRTDLAGKLIAGGSLTHIKGFIGGARECGFESIYIADYPLLNHPISIVVKPNPLLDFFDEIQLMDYHFRLIRKTKKCLKNLPVGLLYQRHSAFNASGVILSSILNIPLVLEVNSSEVWAKKNWSRLVFEKLAMKIERFAFEKATLISVVSEITKKQIIELGAKEDKIILNPNGVDPNKFSPEVKGDTIRQELGLIEYFVVGFIGTFTKWHGVETLFEAAVEVVSKNEKIKFLLIGDGNLKSVLELRTEQLNLKDKIIFTGIIPHDKAPFYLAACDVLVSPHLGFESGERFFGSPTKLFEYMAMGKPIIASDLEQIGQIIKDEINGLKFKPGNANELANQILRLFENPQLREKLGKQAREDVIQNYTWKQNAMRVLSKYFDLN